MQLPRHPVSRRARLASFPLMWEASAARPLLTGRRAPAARPGCSNALKGCANDVRAMYDMLTTCYAFEPGSITTMLDTDRSTPQPTGANIKVGVRRPRARPERAGGGRPRAGRPGKAS